MTVDESRALHLAVNGLLEQDPMRSAAMPLMGWQRLALWGGLVAVATGVVFWPQATAIILVGLCTAAYVFTILDRVLIFRHGLATRAIVVTDDEARSIPDSNCRPTPCWCRRSGSPRSSVN